MTVLNDLPPRAPRKRRLGPAYPRRFALGGIALAAVALMVASGCDQANEGDVAGGIGSEWEEVGGQGVGGEGEGGFGEGAGGGNFGGMGGGGSEWEQGGGGQGGDGVGGDGVGGDGVGGREADSGF